MEFIIEIEGNLSEYTKFFDTEILPVICGVIEIIKRKVLMLDGKVEISFCENSLKLLYLKYGKSVHYPKKYFTYLKKIKYYYKIKIIIIIIIVIYKKNLSDQSICKIEEWICKV